MESIDRSKKIIDKYSSKQSKFSIEKMNDRSILNLTQGQDFPNFRSPQNMTLTHNFSSPGNRVNQRYGLERMDMNKTIRVKG